ncbi:F0F1 ATP synthase subunit A [Candidatus Parcubacteria bacterium]|nr:MAG: F0F1 ATP synthase subunit A [Candidatus Parcubacteria bacterium]
MDFIQLKRELPGVSPEIVFNIFGFPVSNTFLMGLFIIGLLLLFALSVRKFSVKKPSGFQTFIEFLYEGILGLLDQISGSRKMSEKLLPLIGSLFVYIGLSNLIELIPGLSNITLNGKQIFRSPTTDFNTTFGLAFATVAIIQMASIQSWGFFGHVGKYLQFRRLIEGAKNGFADFFMAFIEFLIGMTDIISDVAKIISLSFRLFGNIYAGQVMAIIMLGALAYLLPAVWSSLGIFFGLVQAIVFGSLAATYFMIAVKPEE